MSCFHVSNEVRGRLINVVTHYQTAGPAGGDAGEKAKIQSATEGHFNATSIQTNRSSQLHTSNEGRRLLMNALTHC
jgi:hypothetical protein